MVDSALSRVTHNIPKDFLVVDDVHSDMEANEPLPFIPTS
jgi:hypothetical protein